MRLTHWIDGKASEAASGRWMDVFDPATGQPYAQVGAGFGVSTWTSPSWLEALIPARV